MNHLQCESALRQNLKKRKQLRLVTKTRFFLLKVELKKLTRTVCASERSKVGLRGARKQAGTMCL